MSVLAFFLYDLIGPDEEDGRSEEGHPVNDDAEFMRDVMAIAGER